MLLQSPLLVNILQFSFSLSYTGPKILPYTFISKNVQLFKLQVLDMTKGWPCSMGQDQICTISSKLTCSKTTHRRTIITSKNISQSHCNSSSLQKQKQGGFRPPGTYQLPCDLAEWAQVVGRLLGISNLQV